MSMQTAVALLVDPSASNVASGTAKAPVLTASHNRRLRQLWSLGRPAHLGELGGVELDLIVNGLLEQVTTGRHAGPVVTVTPAGVVHLSSVRQARVTAQQPHHDLGTRLAMHLRARGFFTWENVQFQVAGGQLVRPDVYACRPSLLARNAEPAIYEVKVSRADYLADLARPAKRGAYSALAQAVYYCTPAGLVHKGELPDGCGLLEEQPGGTFFLVKRARRARAFAVSADIAMTLMVKRQVRSDDASTPDAPGYAT